MVIFCAEGQALTFVQTMSAKTPFPIPWFLLAMVLAFVTMSTIQIVWLRTSVQMREELFDDNVYHSLNQVGEMLTTTSTGMLQIDLEALATTNENTRGISTKSSIGTGLDEEEVRMLNRIEALRIDSILPVILIAHGITIPPTIGVFDRYGQPVRLQEADVEFREEMAASAHKIALNSLSINLFFPNKGRYLLQN